MVSNKNIFYTTNPARITDALWEIIDASNVDLRDMLIFLPSRRAVRGVEQYLVNRIGHSIILPRLVALGEGDDEDVDDTSDAIPNTMRLITMAKLLAADASIGNIATALPVARDLMRMQDYLENEGVCAANINWSELVDEKYAAHFQRKAALLDILSGVQDEIADKRPTQTQLRNNDIRAWIGKLSAYRLVIVCGSTASVPATADLMMAVAASQNGRIILSGHICGAVSDFELNTNPYNAEYKLLKRIGITPDDVIPIDVGSSAIEFFNHAFSNDVSCHNDGDAVRHCHLIECARESEEAAVVAEIASRAVSEKKSVLIITPDAAGNQRIAASIQARGLSADFSGGITGAMTDAGRAILNAFDDWMDAGNTSVFDDLYARNNYDLMNTVVQMIDDNVVNFAPAFDPGDNKYIPVWCAIKDLSDCLNAMKMRISIADARAFLSDVISSVAVRGEMNPDADIIVLGTIESRMQTADVIILTGLNDGMFPARGYENAWLPRDLAEKIGLPSPDRKVSLQSLDFMNLSCGSDVYWTRSAVSGGVKTIESRFLSRVAVSAGNYDLSVGRDILNAVRARDVVPMQLLDYSAPNPPADWSDVYVTELETLIHNPYAFYVQHILRLRVLDDYWMPPDARAFGDLVHRVIETARGLSPDALIFNMDTAARSILGPDSVMFHFWHKRFCEIAPVVSDVLSKLENAAHEINGHINIAGRTIRARADCVWDGGVMDIKTGNPPQPSQLKDGNMPQLPLEAYMLQNNGFGIKTTDKSKSPIMIFLQLKNNDVRPIEYDAQATQSMIDAAVAKTKDLVHIYSVGGAPYEYHETGDRRYKKYDDLARCDD